MNSSRSVYRFQEQLLECGEDCGIEYECIEGLFIWRKDNLLLCLQVDLDAEPQRVGYCITKVDHPLQLRYLLDAGDQASSLREELTGTIFLPRKLANEIWAEFNTAAN